jgi:uncharacterized protein YjbI with pentapeptide repeats
MMSQRSRKAAKTIKPPDIPDDLSTEGLPADTVRDRGTYDYLALSQLDLGGQRAEYATFEATRFSHVSMSESNFPGLSLLDVRLEDCDLANAGLYKASLQRVELVASRIVGLKAGGAEFHDVLFKECKGSFSFFRSAIFKSVRFEDCDLTEADLGEADLSGVIFSRCNLTRCDMAGAKLAGTDFRGSNLDGLKVGLDDLQGAIVDPSQALGFAMLLGLVVKGEEE